MSSELVERLQITVRQSNESLRHLIERWQKDRSDALARIEALEAENARKDAEIDRLKRSLMGAAVFAQPAMRRAREGGNADG